MQIAVLAVYHVNLQMTHVQQQLCNNKLCEAMRKLYEPTHKRVNDIDKHLVCERCERKRPAPSLSNKETRRQVWNADIRLFRFVCHES